jgi:hypothetical protein
MLKKQLTIAFTVSLAAFLGTTSAVQLRQLAAAAPELAAPLEAVPLVEALPTQEVSALAAPAINEPVL